MRVAAILLLVSTAALGGCAVTDRYADRSENFNREADDFYNKVVLLNAVRASYDAPMQFTELQSVTGQTTSSGMLALSTPIVGFPSGAAPALSPSVSGSTQTIFSAAVQNTQEFYQGVSTPLSPVQASYFVRTVGPKELVYGLLFGNVTMYRSDGDCHDDRKRYLIACTLVFENNPRNRQNFGLFQATMEYLIRLGLSMESVQLVNSDKTLTFHRSKEPSETKIEQKDESARQVARYCFRPRFTDHYGDVTSADSLCGRSTTERFFKRSENQYDQSPTIKLDGDFIGILREILSDRDVVSTAQTDMEEDDADPDDDPGVIQSSLNSFIGKTVRVELTTRSTLDMFNYVGKIIGQQRKTGTSPLLIRSSIPASSTTLPCNFDPQEACGPILLVSNQEADADLSVQYGREVFGLVPNRVQKTYGLYTIAILKRVLGLNTSSKNTPAPVILTSAPPL